MTGKPKKDGGHKGQSILHTHNPKYDVCRTIQKECFCSRNELSKKTATELINNNRSPYAVNFYSTTFKQIRIEKDILGQDIYKKYTDKHIINFFSGIEDVFQINILHNLPQPILSLHLGGGGVHDLPVQLFWECLHSDIKKVFPDHTDILKNLTILFSACGKTFNFTTK